MTQPNDAGASVPADAEAPVQDDGGTTVCADGTILCSGACIDPTSDPANCNGCGNPCASGVCGTSLSAPMTSQPAGWAFNGSAVFDSFVSSAALTQGAVALQAGTVLYSNPVAMDGMDATFGFRIGAGGGGRGDGMGFVLEQNGPAAVGASGGGLGMGGLTGFGVELDILDNEACGDSSDDHVGVDDLATCPAQAGMPTSLFEADVTSVLDLGDGQWHQAEVTLSSGAFSLTIDGTPIFSNVALTGVSAGPTYYVGFAGATGNSLTDDGGTGGYRQEVRDVVITFPTPRCL